jgi:hypothetical protein
MVAQVKYVDADVGSMGYFLQSLGTDLIKTLQVTRADVMDLQFGRNF